MAGVTAVKRGHAADAVFDQLAATILRGELAAGGPMPPERVLAERFGVSRVIARQAVHRLAEMGLVRVRQGGATTVLAPDDASDVRVIELLYRIGPRASREARELTERQALEGLALVTLAAHRASKEELGELLKMVERQMAQAPESSASLDFERRFWRKMADAGKNRLYVFAVNWYFRVLGEHAPLHEAPLLVREARLTFYREIVERLLAGEEPARFYLEAIGPLLRTIASPPPTPPPRRRRRSEAS